MIEPAWRLAIALPAILLLLGGVLLAARRGLIKLPGTTLGAPPLRIVQVASLAPHARLAVVEFGGEQLLIGAGRDGLRLLARA